MAAWVTEWVAMWPWTTGKEELGSIREGCDRSSCLFYSKINIEDIVQEEALFSFLCSK